LLGQDDHPIDDATTMDDDVINDEDDATAKNKARGPGDTMPTRIDAFVMHGWQLAKIQFAVQSKKDLHIGERLPRIFMSLGSPLPTKFIVIEA
jgi:hypothetical protein